MRALAKKAAPTDLVSPSARPEMAEAILQQIAADARAGIEGGEDEERLEHEGEVVPEVHAAAAGETR